MKFSELLNWIDSIAEKEKYEKEKRKLFDTGKETADELYVKSCDEDDAE